MGICRKGKIKALFQMSTSESVLETNSHSGGCGLTCLYLWVFGCMRLLRPALVKGGHDEWKTSQPFNHCVPTVLTTRLSGSSVIGPATHLWTFWVLRRWAQYFNQCGYWLSRVVLKSSSGMCHCSVHILLHLWLPVGLAQNCLCRVDCTSAASDEPSSLKVAYYN